MKHDGPLGGVIQALENDPSTDPVTVIAVKVALMDISERLQRLEAGMKDLILTLALQIPDVSGRPSLNDQQFDDALREIMVALSPALAEQGKEA